MERVLGIAAAGAVGSLARYWLSQVVQGWLGMAFPWGTFVVNMLGSFLFGLVWALAEQKLVISAEMRVILLSGFMGAFTTFSTFAFETTTFLRDGLWGMALVNSVVQVVVGVGCMAVGLAVGSR